jgi:hypothetical protein
LPYTLECMVKSRPSPLSTLNGQEREKRKKMLVLPWLGCLATYVGCLLYASLSRLGGDIHPTIILTIIRTVLWR